MYLANGTPTHEILIHYFSTELVTAVRICARRWLLSWRRPRPDPKISFIERTSMMLSKRLNKVRLSNLDYRHHSNDFFRTTPRCESHSVGYHLYLHIYTYSTVNSTKPFVRASVFFKFTFIDVVIMVTADSRWEIKILKNVFRLEKRENMESNMLISVDRIVEEEQTFYPGSFFSCEVNPVRPAELERMKRISNR